ncbi:CHAD domain-containing protein [Bradyrhizobium acaciae]|uniref:CHAD domain-containing protein n=1 Tax=Bradyrhizobium acaciae TaxID=2683706 RepID=UPI001E5FD8B1|nr:CHAD domain-containing protein [Bradyrhizobium acaciae]
MRGDVLDRRIRKARKQGKRLRQLDAKQRHKLRIKIKKIRYAVDFFRSLYEDADQKTLTRVSAALEVRHICQRLRGKPQGPTNRRRNGRAQSLLSKPDRQAAVDVETRPLARNYRPGLLQ